MAQFAIIAGSPSQNSRSSVVVEIVRDWIVQQGHIATPWEARDLPPDVLLHANFGDPTFQQAVASIQDADAVVLVSPIYKAIYSGVLKAFIDLWPQEILKNKALFAIAVGASPAHHATFDAAVRQLGGELAAARTLTTSFISDKHVIRDVERRGIADEATQDVLLEQLHTLMLAVEGRAQQTFQHAS